MSRILIIEDEAALASAMGAAVKGLGHEAVTCASAMTGLEKIVQKNFALVILDIGLPDMSGLEVLARIRERHDALPVLMITAHGNLQNAVEAKKRGASGYLVKPLDLKELQTTVSALLLAGMSAESAGESDAKIFTAPLLIGSSAAMQPAFAAIAHATASDAPVLITGPTGIGKSLAARVIHLHSRRHAAPFVTLSCASLPETLLEAELFGYEKGAFTGATGTRPGHIERAAGGTLFLDEIAEIPPAVQVKLLRFVDEKVFARVGGREDLQVDLRIIAATNQDLVQAVADRRFREDLFYRLKVLEVKLPPLKDRAGDLPALCSYLLARISGDRKLAISADALQLLSRHDWPGNVRELRNALEHANAVCSGASILPQHLPEELVRALHEKPVDTNQLQAAMSAWLDMKLEAGEKYDAIHEELESLLLAALLPRFEGKPTLMARELEMNRATLRKKLREPAGDEC